MLKTRKVISFKQQQKNNQLFEAITLEDIEKIKQALAEGAQIDAVHHLNETALHKAVLQGNDEIVDLLLTKGADVNAINKIEQTPLHLAVINKHEKIVKILINNNANIEDRDTFGTTPLYIAADKASEKAMTSIIKMLINKGADMHMPGPYNLSPFDILKNKNYDLWSKLAQLVLSKEMKNPAFTSSSFRNKEDSNISDKKDKVLL